MSLLQSQATTNAERHAGLAGAWLASLTSENTQRAYRRDLSALLSFLDAGGLDALAAERKHVDLWRSTLDGAPSSIARRLAAVSSFYQYAHSEGLVTVNPVANVKRPKIDPDFTATQGLTKQQAQNFLKSARDDSARSYALAALLLDTGVRISEALNSNRSDLQHDSGHRVLIVTLKGGKRAKVALPPQVIDALAGYLGESEAEGTQIAATDAASMDAPLFSTATGKRWANSEAFRTIQRLARAAGIEGAVSPHSLRHTHATLALDDGVTLVDLQDSLHHADPRTTRRYDHSKGRLEKSSSYRVAALLG